MRIICRILILLVFIISNTFCASSDSTFFKHALNADVYYQLIPLSDSTYRIEWGGKNFVNTSIRTYEKGEVTGSGHYIFEAANNEAMLLSGGCGQSCQMYMVLPLFKGADEKIYMDVQALDISNNMIAYTYPGDDLEIIIENYITSQHMLIKEQNVCGAASALDCIDECFFKDDSLFIKWQKNEWNANRPDLQVETYPIQLSELDEERAIPGIMRFTLANAKIDSAICSIIKSEKQCGHSIDEDIMMIGVNEVDDYLILSLGLFDKEALSWYISTIKDTIAGYIEGKELTIFVIGDYRNLFPESGRSTQFDYYELLPKKREDEMIDMIFEPVVHIYRYKNGQIEYLYSENTSQFR